MQETERLKDLLLDQKWRLNNLYHIKDPNGNKVPFRLNYAQANFLHNIHFFNVILKARQLGFTTFIDIYFLDACLFNSNHACGIIAQGLNEASDIFDNKIRFAYDNLPDWLKEARTCTEDNARKLVFNNGSSITVGTSMRSGTLQKLHISEYGKISAKYPDKAKEIKTGAFNTVHSGQQIFVESTAEGQGGEFFELCELARRLDLEGKELTPLDPKFHFYPWFKNPSYVMSLDESARQIFTDDITKYFNKLREDDGISLTLPQRAWYAKKAELMGEDMMREYPSTPDESFASSLEGSIYSKQMAQLRKSGQITTVPWEPKSLVHTFWDLGQANFTAVWFFQQVGREYRMIRYLQASGQDLTEITAKARGYGYTFGTHYLPHDGDMKRLSMKNMTVTQMFHELGFRPTRVVPRTRDLWGDIQAKCKLVMPKIWFDERNCKEGITCLDNYRKEWDDKRGVWKDYPKHDEFSDGADAFRTFAVGYTEHAQSEPISFSLPTGTMAV